MKRYGFIFGILLTTIAFLALGQTYVTHVGQGWLIEGATLKNCDIMGSLGPPAGLGTIYYCDNNAGSDDENGLSWETSFKTLAVAMAASHAKIASGGHATDRNIIYYTADAETADLTALAQKTDIIGVGSCDFRKGPVLIGHHVIVPFTTTATNYQGCRFFNVTFYDDDAAGILWDIDDQAGIEFHECKFAFKLTDTIGLRIDESCMTVVNECHFSSLGVGSATGFSTAAIQVVNGTKSSFGTTISNCRIQSGAIGIDWDETESYGSLIIDNIIRAVGQTIDCEDANVTVIGNRMITDVDGNTYAVDTGWDFEPTNSVDNLLGHSGNQNSVNTVPDLESKTTN